jgi:antitoxin of RelE/RelB toxin-antitoxin system
MFNEVTITAFREQSGPVFTAAVQGHRPQVIRRGREDRGLLLGLDDAWAMVADRSFAPQVTHGEDAVGVWLPEFEVYGEGSTYADAKQDLMNEVRVYVAEYLANADEYRRAPNRAGHFPHVVKALIAETRGELEQAIFPAPPDLATLRAQVAAGASA